VPLRISIDVDDTLLDKDGNLVPDAVRGLQLLRAAGHPLQLWSAGGAEYSLVTAQKHGIAEYFTSFASKADVAIDDLPMMAKPSTIVLVSREHSFTRAVERTLQLESTVDAAQTVSQDVVRLVKQLQAEAGQVRRNHAVILREDIPLHPVPFFGAIQQARVITVGLNPSSTEFEEPNRWPQQMAPEDLARRLVDYFRDPTITPHHYFAELQQALTYIHCPYHLCAAHVDVSPWSTYSPTAINKRHPEARSSGLQSYNALLEDGMNRWLPQTIQLCKASLQLVIACTSPTPKNAEEVRLERLAQFFGAQMGSRWASERFVRLPKGEIAKWIWTQRKELIAELGLEGVHT
jgi:hypothetical protein